LLNDGKLYWESETLTEENRLHECIMTRLRTREGISLHLFEMQFGLYKRKQFELICQKYIDQKLAFLYDGYFFLTIKAWFISDKIILNIIRELI
jgi:coproporphyrinogen III oxidase-like Fe-S oxidoreductase